MEEFDKVSSSLLTQLDEMKTVVYLVRLCCSLHTIQLDKERANVEKDTLPLLQRKAKELLSLYAFLDQYEVMMFWCCVYVVDQRQCLQETGGNIRGSNNGA